MKTQLLKTTLFMLILACVFSSCKKPNDPEPGITYPVDIPFTEYSLEGNSCQWKNLPYDEKVILINSKETLENYISCAKSSYPEIDFSKNSLLLISGKTGQKITEIFTKGLKQVAPDKHEFDINITMDPFFTFKPWCVAVLVEKITKKTDVKLNVDYSYLPQEPHSLLGTWVLVEKEKDGVIETIPEDDPYAMFSIYCVIVSLNFISDTTLHGRCEANVYKGTYHMYSDNISLTYGVTDVMGSEWYWSYINKLGYMHKVSLTDSTMQLSDNHSSIFNFVSREKFERDYFELPAWYNF